MYQSPDVIKVRVKIDDVFASYNPTGCPFEGVVQYTQTIYVQGEQCKTHENYDLTYIGSVLGWQHQCYAVMDP
ncbi:MAG: hypothetical protein K6F76_07790 [Clostridiales bacterium]|nr:hypothetical protein [Clostridiales bacterium]